MLYTNRLIKNVLFTLTIGIQQGLCQKVIYINI